MGRPGTSEYQLCILKKENHAKTPDTTHSREATKKEGNGDPLWQTSEGEKNLTKWYIII